MRTLRHRRVGLLASLAALCALALTAGPAAAWNTEAGGMKLSGTIAVSTPSSKAINCTFPATQDGTVFNEFEFEASTPPSPPPFFIPYAMVLSCEGGKTLEWNPAGLAWESSAQIIPAEGYVGKSAGGNMHDPFASSYWWPGNVAGLDWVNASGKIASHIAFSKDQIGLTSTFEPVYATGNAYFTTLAGGELTLP